MAFDGLLVTEIFHSLQGETSLAGTPFAFIRLSGCNLRCTYCDTTYAFKGGTKMSIPDILRAIAPFQVKHVLLTGGEPLLQRPTMKLVTALTEANYIVSIETHGEVPIAPVAGKARIIMDIKTPSSGMCRMGFVENLPYLRESDEVKFVIASPEDYVWAREILERYPIRASAILFSPALPPAPSVENPGHYPGVTPKFLAESMLRDRVPARMQLQLHKLIWGQNARGV